MNKCNKQKRDVIFSLDTGFHCSIILVGIYGNLQCYEIEYNITFLNPIGFIIWPFLLIFIA